MKIFIPLMRPRRSIRGRAIVRFRGVEYTRVEAAAYPFIGVCRVDFFGWRSARCDYFGWGLLDADLEVVDVAPGFPIELMAMLLRGPWRRDLRIVFPG